MLHIRNTLHKHKYLENDTLSWFLTCVLRVILHLEHLPLQPRNCHLHTEPGRAENRSFSILFPSFWSSRANSQPHQVHAPLFTSICIAPYRALQWCLSFIRNFQVKRKNVHSRILVCTRDPSWTANNNLLSQWSYHACAELESY